MNKTRLYLQNSPMSLSLEGWFYHEEPGAIYSAKPIEFVKILDDEVNIYPATFSIGRLERSDFAQCLIDELYRLGFRPTDAVNADKTDIKAHLEDMRTLVFNPIREVKP
jgi:hypothetical protein